MISMRNRRNQTFQTIYFAFAGAPIGGLTSHDAVYFKFRLQIGLVDEFDHSADSLAIGPELFFVHGNIPHQT
ncbi:hypothetical protein HAPAU_38110 [Halalkalicoccus paucihalophilus]|uniref:Uncharacterized protein n=1 Tax=Halalkalicoccus paucihalophilus TaxID=1008153 RepID=A0A151A8Z0_9EURY|nr:hypothetical protein HAPAU_38110 [Halalkalicoccus paucihalophilus]